MSDRRASAEALPATVEPVRVAARRLRWFRAALARFLDRLGGEIGCDFEVDEPRLAAAFVSWLRAVAAQKPHDPGARRAYFEFAAGLMLRELVRDMPIRATRAPDRAAPDSAARFWPEGYAATTFCMAVTAAALRQEFDADFAVAPEMDDVRQWWSFRENAAEDPAMAVAFLDMFTGHEPDWMTPGLFPARLRRELGASLAAAVP